MKSKEFSTPSRQNRQESLFCTEDNIPYKPETQNTPQSNQDSARKKAHNPLCLSSSKYQAKGVISTYFQDPSTNVFDSTDVTHSCVASEPINGPSHIPIIEHLDLNNFKIKPCSIATQHNHKHCPFYHNAKDRKRVGYFYSAELCDFAEKENVTCPNGDMCQRAHNRVEQLYRPEKYKTKFCTFYPHNLEKCDYGTFCSFAHNENDISIELVHNYEYDEDFYMFHFKTIWCPFNLTQHDKALCVYAHNWQDYRRKPQIYTYEPSPCSNWKSTDFILNYEDGCPFKEKCSKCHGWKEHEYHPLNYKTKPCPAGKNCSKGRDCPHYHSTREKRGITQNIASRVFRYVPRNRIVTNTFKVRSEEKPIYNYQNVGVAMYQANSNISTYPSLNFSHDADSFYEPIPSIQSYSDQFVGSGNIPRNPMPTSLNEVPMKPFEFRERENKETINTKFRKQSYDFGPMNYSRKDSESTSSNLSKNEAIPPGLNKLERTSSMETNPKPRRWSTHDEGSFNQESDRLFREIVMSSFGKEQSSTLESSPVRNLRNYEEKEELGDAEMNDNIMIDRILGSEDV